MNALRLIVIFMLLSLPASVARALVDAEPDMGRLELMACDFLACSSFWLFYWWGVRDKGEIWQKLRK